VRTLCCTAASLLFLTWAVTALAAHEPARVGGTPAIWLATTCAAISTLQHGVAERWGGTTPPARRSSLTANLARDAADADSVLLATSRELPGVPHGAAIAASIHARAAALRRYIATARSAARVGDVAATAAAARAGLQMRSTQLGVAFIHLERSYPSTELASAINQAPSCALVHG
jgi:hypothetical protein